MQQRRPENQPEHAARRPRRADRASRPAPATRQPFARRLALTLGILLIPIALLGLGARAQHSLTWRTAEQILVGELAPLLIAIGLSSAWLGRLARLPAAALLAPLSNPLSAAALWAADLYLWHLPALFESTLHHPLMRVLQELCFFGFALNMWLSLLGATAKPPWFGVLGRTAQIAFTRIALAVLANIFLWSGTVAYPYFIHPDVQHQLSPIVDQNIAGALLLIADSLLALALIVWLHARTREQSPPRRQRRSAGAAAALASSEAAPRRARAEVT